MARVAGARRSGLLLGVAVLVHVVAISHQVDGGGGVSLLERSVLTALAPFQRATAGTVHGFRGLWGSYVDLRGVHSDNLALRQRVQRLELELREHQDKARQADRLRELLELRGRLPRAAVVAEVIARDGLPWFRTLTLNKGLQDGVALNSPVISSSGVVGRVIGVGSGVARVQLIWDRDCGVGVAIERSRVTGVVTGRVGLQETESADLLMRSVPLLGDVVPGDIVVTSSLDRIFPKGLMVGTVSAIGAVEGMFKEVLVTPSARLHQLEEVLVLRPLPEESPITERVQ